MKYIVPILIIPALLLAAFNERAGLWQKQKAEPEAEIVFKNGNIYTGNDDKPKAEAVAAKYGKIVFVGSNAEAKKYEVKGVKVIDLKGDRHRHHVERDGAKHPADEKQHEITVVKSRHAGGGGLAGSAALLVFFAWHPGATLNPTRPRFHVADA